MNIPKSLETKPNIPYNLLNTSHSIRNYTDTQDLDGFNSGYRQYPTPTRSPNQHIYPLYPSQFYSDNIPSSSSSSSTTYNNRLYGGGGGGNYYQQPLYNSPRSMVGDYIPSQYNQDLYDIIY